MKRKLNYLIFAFSLVIASCAIITVNIYFPEKDVQEAYKALEKELMTDQKNGVPRQEVPSGERPRSESFLRFELVPTAYAQEPGMAEKIAETVKKMPEVVNAYKDMGSRIAAVDRLRDAGLAGEASDGLLASREAPLSPADASTIEMENANRLTVIRGMAKAIIRINRVQENQANLDQVLPQAKEQFAAIRRDSAKKGWWIQDANGNWSRKQ